MLRLFTLCFIFFALLGPISGRTFRVRPHEESKDRYDLDGNLIKTPEHQVVVRVPEGDQAAQELADREGFVLKGKVLENKDYYLFVRTWEEHEANPDHLLRESTPHYQELKPNYRKAGRGLGSALLRMAGIETMAPDVEVRTEVDGITDRGYTSQWHHHGRTAFGSEYRIFLNSTAAWAQGATGRGVVTAVVDDGLAHNHQDISPNYEARCSLNVVDSSSESDPMPSDGDHHGTAAAAVAAGAKDGTVCGVGVAYDASLAGIKLLPSNRMPTDAEEARALSYKAFETNGKPHVSVYSNSWGTPDTGRLLGSAGPLLQEAMHDVATRGRNGLGSVYVWAAGNGAQYGDQANLDALCNSIYSICVGAVSDIGYISDYSEAGDCVTVSAPSDGGLHKIFSDFGPSRSHDSCTNSFGGTSAACPQVAGLVALVLQANPRLTARDVQHIVIQAAQDRVLYESMLAEQGGVTRGMSLREESHQWVENGAGLHHSSLFGFGLADAGRSVEKALTWVNLPEASTYETEVTVPSHERYISGMDIGVYTVTVPVRSSLPVYNLEHVELEVDLDFGSGRMSDVDHISLTSPDGTRSVLLWSNKHRSRHSLQWNFMSVKHWLEHPSGTWTVRIRNTGTYPVEVKSLKMYLHGFERLPDQQ